MLGLFKRKKAADPKEQLRKVLGDIELPTFPVIVTQVLEKLRDENVSFKEISDLLTSDPGLTVKLLGTVNSAAFALRQQVRSVHHAVSMLGRNQLESTLISVAARRAVPNPSARGFETQRFWGAAACRATVARGLAELIDPSTRSETFTAALLQDLAVPFLSMHQGDPYSDVLESWHDGPGDLAQLERAEFGWDHSVVAGWICLDWGMPAQITEAIATHHGARDSATSAGPLPAVELVAALREVNVDLGIERLVETAAERFQIPKDSTHELICGSAQAAAEIAALFS